MIDHTRHTTGQPSRDLYASEGLSYIPNILTMLDQNPFSKTYGCGDRPYWLYKSVDYPCGMYGEFCLPLALVYSYPFPNNPYFGEARIRDLSIAVIRNQILSAHSDGSNDDFYPWEKAVGSTAFTLYAMAETVRVLELDDPSILDFLAKRGRWLSERKESGRLTNHHALVALGLASVNRLIGDNELQNAGRRIRDTILDWQSAEGWFPEYDGFDPGYHTFTVSFLAYLREISDDDTLTQPLERAVELAAQLIGPDGSYGGEIGSRNSYHFMPHGFELLAEEFGAARHVADLFLECLARGNRSYLDENRTFCHYQYNFLQAWLDHSPREHPDNWQPSMGITLMPEAGLLSVRKNDIHAVVSTKKGGVIKASTSAGPLASDTGIVLATEAGKLYAHSIVGDGTFTVTRDDEEELSLQVNVNFDKVPNSILPTTFRLMMLRLVSNFIGRIEPNFLRKFIQYLLIGRRSKLAVKALRYIQIRNDQITVTDELQSEHKSGFARLASSTDLTTIYTASSNAWHASRFFPWQEYPDKLDELNRTGKTAVTRQWNS